MLPGNLSHKKQTIRKKGKSRYASKAYSNPFFPNKKKKRLQSLKLNLNWKAKIFIFFLLAFFVGLIWAVFYSGLFNIKKITVTGGGRVDTDSVRELANKQINDNYLVLFPQKNLWLFRSNYLRKTLEEKYAFNTLTIKKKWPNELAINYDEKDYALIWQEGNKYYYSDKAGFMIKEINPIDVKQKDYPIIENRSDKKISSREASVGQDIIAYALALFKGMKAYQNDFTIDRIIIDNELKTIKLFLLDGPEIYFNTDNDIDKQIEKLIVIKREKISRDFMNKIYIDVRYGNSVYYR